MPKTLRIATTKKTLLVNQPQLDALKQLLAASSESDAVRTAIARAIHAIRRRGRY